VRGGSVPLLLESLLLAVMLAMNWIWTSDMIQVATFAFAVMVLAASAIALAVASKGESVRRGPPRPEASIQTQPQSSLGAVLAAIALAATIFGLAFGRFLVFFGSGLFVASLGRLAVEQRAQRSARGEVEREEP
jgi:cobalamin synthase